MKYPDTKVDTGSQGVPPAVVTGPTYNLTFDTMSRPITMRKSGAAIDTVKDVLYNVAGQMTQMRWLTPPCCGLPNTSYYKETRTYNNRLQLTQLTTDDETGPTGTVLGMSYTYSARQNNGRITQQTDSVSGEQVNYQYDSLNRLASAVTTGPEWGHDVWLRRVREQGVAYADQGKHFPVLDELGRAD